MTIADSDRIHACRAQPGAEALVAVLEGCQDRVYNVCYQVLRHAEDAEDAAQESLLKVAEGVASGVDPRHFDPWMYRVAFNTALNALKRSKRRTAHENRRALMVDSAPPTDGAHEAVHQAMGELDDDSRCAVIQHFFEQRTLEEIAGDQGCSSVAVWKRIDKAKAALRESLRRSGVGAALPLINGVFQSIQPAIAPAGLLSKSLIAKAKREPRFSARKYTRCNRCGRPRAVYRKFGLCRICLRELAHEGAIPGMTKSSW